jgi:hypothetical protein
MALVDISSIRHDAGWQLVMCDAPDCDAIAEIPPGEPFPAAWVKRHEGPASRYTTGTARHYCPKHAGDS